MITNKIVLLFAILFTVPFIVNSVSAATPVPEGTYKLYSGEVPVNVGENANWVYQVIGNEYLGAMKSDFKGAISFTHNQSIVGRFIPTLAIRAGGNWYVCPLKNPNVTSYGYSSDSVTEEGYSNNWDTINLWYSGYANDTTCYEYQNWGNTVSGNVTIDKLQLIADERSGESSLKVNLTFGQTVQDSGFGFILQPENFSAFNYVGYYNSSGDFVIEDLQVEKVFSDIGTRFIFYDSGMNPLTINWDWQDMYDQFPNASYLFETIQVGEFAGLLVGIYGTGETTRLDIDPTVYSLSSDGYVNLNDANSEGTTTLIMGCLSGCSPDYRRAYMYFNLSGQWDPLTQQVIDGNVTFVFAGSGGSGDTYYVQNRSYLASPSWSSTTGTSTGSRSASSCSGTGCFFLSGTDTASGRATVEGWSGAMNHHISDSSETLMVAMVQSAAGTGRYVTTHATEASGTANDPYVEFTVENLNSPPQWENETVNDSSPFRSEVIQFSSDWTDDIAFSYYVVEHNNSGSLVNESALTMPSDNSTNINLTVNSSFSVDDQLAVRFWVNDSEGEWNVTDYIYATVTNQVPQWENETVNDSTPSPNNSLLFSANWTDEYNLSGYIVEHNNTGNLSNESFVSMTGTSNYSTHSLDINSSFSVDDQLFLRFWANDSDNEWNVTDWVVATITNAAPAINSISTTPTSPWDYVGSGYELESIVNVTDSDSNVSAVYCYISWPNSTLGVNNVNGTQSGDLWTCPNITIDQVGSYNVSILATDGISNTWYNNSSEFVVTDDAPTISNVAVSLYFTYADVVWTTDKTANSSLSVSPAITYSNSSSFVTSHSIRLEQPAESTQYSFTVTSCSELSGNCSTSTTKYFTALSAGGNRGGSSCTSVWSCTEWSTCDVTGKQYRICNDERACGGTQGKPNETQNCNYTSSMNISFPEGINLTWQQQLAESFVSSRFVAVVNAIRDLDFGLAIENIIENFKDYWYSPTTIPFPLTLLFTHAAVFVAMYFVGFGILYWLGFFFNRSQALQLIVSFGLLPLLALAISLIMPTV